VSYDPLLDRKLPGEPPLRQRRLHRQLGFKLAVVTSSRSCTAVLKAAGLETVFDLQIDGNVIRHRHLAG
jgi:beta-phosphoglucomutase-like phosphatase (HAD superfamily)